MYPTFCVRCYFHYPLFSSIFITATKQKKSYAKVLFLQRTLLSGTCDGLNLSHLKC